MCSGSDRFGVAEAASMDCTQGFASTDVECGGLPVPSERGCADSVGEFAGAQTGRFAGRGRPARDNIIVSWLREREGSMRAYLKYLVDSDLSLNESLRGIYGGSRPGHRLALALFMDFAHEQCLGPGELAPLMGDAQRDLLEAVCYVIGSAIAEASDDGQDDRASTDWYARDSSVSAHNDRQITLAGAA